jgi:hypothetical protein
MEAEYPETRRRSIFGALSLLFTALMLVLPVVLALLVGKIPEEAQSGPEANRDAWDWFGRLILALFFAVAIGGSCAVAAFVSGLIALLRHERWIALPITSMVLSGAGLVFLAVALFSR